MIRNLVVAILIAASAGMAPAGEAGDAVFADRGPWSLDDAGLRWSLHVEGPDMPGFLPIENGSLTLTRAIDPSDRQPVLRLIQRTDTRTREIGPFPVSGGDPVLTFFLEQVTRDMARLTGGSPHYIRNRIKDALFKGGRIERQGDGAVARFSPFAQDANAARMGGFSTLTLSFVLGDPRQPIRDLRAETQGPEPGYATRMALQ